jgi:hypothetical protein
MSEHWQWDANAAWLPEMKRLGRLLLADRRTQTGNYGLRMRLRYGAGVEMINPSNFTPALTSFGMGVLLQMRDHHMNTMGHSRTMVDFGQFDVMPGKTVYLVSVAPASGAQPSPNPYDEPPIQNIPPSCIPCISPIVYV